MSDSGERIDRRTFLGTSGVLAAGAAVGTTALSYARILGANDRIALGHIGIGNRGSELRAASPAPSSRATTSR